MCAILNEQPPAVVVLGGDERSCMTMTGCLHPHRPLDAAQLGHLLAVETPYGCSGSFKSERGSPRSLTHSLAPMPAQPRPP